MAGHLRLVGPTPPKVRKGRNNRRLPLFSPEETTRLRAALRNARTLFGSWPCAADALYVNQETLISAASGRRLVTANVAVRLAKALGKTLDELIRPPTDAAKCPHCGSAKGPT